MRIAAAFGRQARVTDALDRMIAMHIGGMHERGNVFKSCDHRGGIGVIAGPEKASNVRLLHVGGKRVLAIAGVPLSLGQQLAPLLEQAMNMPFDASLRQLTSLDGSFAAILWDAEAGKAGVVTDFIGLEPLYIAQEEGAFFLSTSIRAIAASGVLRTEPDAAAWGAFLSFGHFLGDRTSVKGIRRVPAASVYVYDTATGQVDSSTYWVYPRPGDANSVTHNETSAVMQGFERSVTAYLEHSPTGTLLLSGGFDSRLVLVALLRAKVSPDILIMDHPDEHADADGRFARRVAKHFGFRYERFRPVRSFYDSNEFLDYIVLNEVSTASLYLYIAQLASCLDASITAVWEGLVPGATLNPPGGSHGADFSEVLRLRAKGYNSAVWRASRLVFSPSYAEELYQSFLDLFREEASRYEDNSAGTSEFMVRNRMRNRTGPNPVKVYSARALPFLPGVTREFFEAAAKVPYDLRSNHRFFIQLYRNEFPEAMKVPFCSSGKLYRGSRVIDPEYWSIKVQASRVYKRLDSAIRARLGQPLEWWDEAPLVNAVVQSVAPESEHLNRDTVRQMQRDEIPADVRTDCKAILFYWQMSKWVMDGTLTSQSQAFRESLPLNPARNTLADVSVAPRRFPVMSTNASRNHTTSSASHHKRQLELLVPEQTVRRLYLAVFAMDALVILVTALSDVGASIARFGIVLWFDLKLEGNIAVWYSSALLLVTAFAALALAANPPSRLLHPYRHRAVWALAAAFFAGLSVDETAQLHETVGRIFVNRIGHIEWLTGGNKPTFAWVLVFLPAIMLFVFVIRTAARSLQGYRRSRNLTLAGVGAWMGVIAAEVVQSQLARFSRERSIQGVIEEGLEILGATFFFVAFVEYLLNTRPRSPEHTVSG